MNEKRQKPVRTIESGGIVVVRRDAQGNEIPQDKLMELSVTNSTIERIMGDVVRRVEDYPGEPLAY